MTITTPIMIHGIMNIGTSTIEMTQQLKKLDAEIKMCEEYLSLTKSSRDLLQRKIDFTDRYLLPENTENNKQNCEAQARHEKPSLKSFYKSHDSLYLNIDLFEYHHTNGKMIYGFYNGSLVVVDATIQVFCHFATFTGTTQLITAQLTEWSKPQNIKQFVFYGFKQQKAHPTYKKIEQLPDDTVVKFVKFDNSSKLTCNGLIMYQVPSCNYYDTRLVQITEGNDFCTAASFQSNTKQFTVKC